MTTSKSPTKRQQFIRSAADHAQFSDALGWLVDCSLAALHGKEPPETPPDLGWLAALRGRAEARTEIDDAQDAADGLGPSTPAENELFTLLDTLVMLQRKAVRIREALLDEARSTKPGRPRSTPETHNALRGKTTLADLSGIRPRAPKQRGKAGPKSMIPEITVPAALEHLERTKGNGGSERARLEALIRERVPDFRRRTRKSADRLAATLAKRVSEARRAFRDRSRNDGNIAAQPGTKADP